MVQRFPKVPKVRRQVELTLSDGTRLSCSLFTDATERVLDLLNAPAAFFAVVDADERVHLINKLSVVRVLPSD